MKVLFVLFKTLGDVLMGTSVVRELKKRNPDMQIDFITQAQNADILKGNPDINEVIVKNDYYEANIYYLENKDKYEKILRVGMTSLHDSIWHHLEAHNKQHLTEWYAKRAGLDGEIERDVFIYLDEDDIADVDDYWDEPDLDKSKKYIVMHTTSGNHPGIGPIESKDWSIDKFNELAKKIINDGYGVIQIGAFSDKKISVDGVIDFTGKFAFKQCGEVIKRCDGFVGVDSGPAYLAGWSGRPSVVIMGATQNTGDHSGPSVGPRTDNVTYINAPKPNDPRCSPVPCYVQCQIGKQGGCISDISVDQVYAKIKEVVEKQ